MDLLFRVADCPAMATPDPAPSRADVTPDATPDAAPDAPVAADAAHRAALAAEDARWLAAFAAGDASAFDRLYARHEQALYRYVRRVLGRSLAAQADEVFQDTWLKVVQARASFNPQAAAFRTWLFTLAQHRAIDVLRRSGREVSVPDNDESPYAPSEPPWADWPAAQGNSASDQLFWRQAGERLLNCLDELPVAQRAVFLLHHDDEHSLDEIARALELGFETAKSRLRYAMGKLRLCMGAYLAPDVWAGAQ